MSTIAIITILMVNDESKLQVDKKRDKQERKILDTQVGFTSNLKIIFFGAILSWNKLDQRSSFLVLSPKRLIKYHPVMTNIF